jgi:methionyl-tRNA synthetase
MPETGDSDFTWEHFAATVNKDLVGVIGNFVNRTLRLTHSRFGSEAVPEGHADGLREDALIDEVRRRLGILSTELEAMHFRKAMIELRTLWVCGNQYLADKEPWKEGVDDGAAAATLNIAINLMRVLALVSWPVIPDTADTILTSLGQSHARRWPSPDVATELVRLKGGAPFVTPPLLFRRIVAAEVDQYRDELSGESGSAGPRLPTDVPV